MSGRVKSSLFLVCLGLFIWICNLGWLSFWRCGRDWPWIIIAVGFAGLLKHLSWPFSHTRRHATRSSDPSHPPREKVADALKKVESGDMSAEEAAKHIRNEQ